MLRVTLNSFLVYSSPANRKKKVLYFFTDTTVVEIITHRGPGAECPKHAAKKAECADHAAKKTCCPRGDSFQKTRYV